MDTSAKHPTDHISVITFSVNRFLTGFRSPSWGVCRLKLLTPQELMVVNLSAVTPGAGA